MNQGRNQKREGWGGLRVGAGRKPTPKAAKSGLVAFPGAKVDPALVEPPEDLPKAQQPIWRAWAPLALEKRTLTAETVPAFATLCDLEARRRDIAKVFDQPGAQPEPGGLRIYLQCVKQVENLMGRFCLAPFGKPVVAEKPKQAANPFAALGGQKSTG